MADDVSWPLSGDGFSNTTQDFLTENDLDNSFNDADGKNYIFHILQQINRFVLLCNRQSAGQHVSNRKQVSFGKIISICITVYSTN